MALSKQLVDGRQTIDQQEQALNFMEQISFAKVISYRKSPGDHPSGADVNEAVLDDVPIGQQPNPLHLEAVDPLGDATAVIAKQLQEGKKVIFHDTAFVESNEKVILGFR